MTSVLTTVVKSHKKLGLLASLYISQLIPLAFLAQAVPVFMREQGISLEVIGLLALLGLPWMLKFLWSPLIDRYGFTKWGHYRFWIICFQSLAACTTFICAFAGVQGSFILTVVCLSLLCFICASQDIATDALAVGLLEPDERGLGNGVQMAGNSLGILIGGGGMLILLDRWGWRGTLLTMSGIMIVALIPVLLHQEQPLEKVTKPKGKGVKNYFMIFVNLFRRPGMRGWLLVAALYGMGYYMAVAMFRPLLVDIKLSLTEIGLLMGVVGSTAAIVGSLVAGFFVTILGRKRSLILFGLLRAFAMTAYFLPAFGFTDLSILYLVVIGVQLPSSMVNTALFTVMMDKSESETAGTDFTVQNSVVSLGTDIGSVLSGFIAGAIGYKGIFTVSIGVSLLGVIAITKFFAETDYSSQKKAVSQSN